MPSTVCTVSPEPRYCSGDCWRLPEPPTSRDSAPPPPTASVVPGIMMPTAWMFRPVGSASRTSSVMTTRCVMLEVSTIGDSPVTVRVSSRAPTFRSALIVAVKSDVSSTPSRTTVEKPGSSNLTVYVPGLSATIEYVPEPLVTVERVFSISTGLDTSTVTPGNTPPDASLTVPEIALVCAEANTGVRTKTSKAIQRTVERITTAPPFPRRRRGNQTLAAGAATPRQPSLTAPTAHVGEPSRQGGKGSLQMSTLSSSYRAVSMGTNPMIWITFSWR